MPFERASLYCCSIPGSTFVTKPSPVSEFVPFIREYSTTCEPCSRLSEVSSNGVISEAIIDSAPFSLVAKTESVSRIVILVGSELCCVGQ